jgi:hypothetical protein
MPSIPVLLRLFTNAELLLCPGHVENAWPVPSLLVTRKRSEGDLVRNVIADEFVTLDGVVQAPSFTDEDMTGGFRHGGWNNSYLDDQSMNWVTSGAIIATYAATGNEE